MPDPDETVAAAEIAARILELPEGQAEGVLAEACAGNAALEPIVRRMLELNRSCPGFLSDPVVTLGPDRAEPRSEGRPGMPAGTRVGQYATVRLIGTGATADVYEARRIGRGPGRKRADDPQNPPVVALKVIRPGVLLPGVQRRFAFEVATLGRLSHPNIARLIDAGSLETDEGPRPYFAMELVNGRDMVTYANERNLSWIERLGLMIQVCAAVQHAHAFDVLHRDLKPANILVDGVGQVKVLDFGVARSIGSDIWTISTLAHEGRPPKPGERPPARSHGSSGRFVGTIPYMSPEQLGLRPEPVDRRSDVYALGVIMYEVFAGRPPYTMEHDRFAQFIDSVRAQAAPRLSEFDRTFRGPISDIAARAMDIDPIRRYQTPWEMAEDIQRCARGQPMAEPRSELRNLARLYAHRHPKVLVGAIAAAVALLIGFAAFAWEFAEVKRAEDHARRSRRETMDIGRLALIDVYNDVGNLPNSRAIQRKIVERAVDQLERFLRADPRDADIIDMLATAYQQLSDVVGNPIAANLGEPERAAELMDRSIQLHRLLVAAMPRDPGRIMALSVSLEHRAMLSRTPKEQSRLLEESADYASQAVSITRGSWDARDRLMRVQFRSAGAAHARGVAADFAGPVKLAEDLHAERGPRDYASAVMLAFVLHEWAEAVIDSDPFLARTNIDRALAILDDAQAAGYSNGSTRRHRVGLEGLDAQLAAGAPMSSDNASVIITLVDDGIEKMRNDMRDDPTSSFAQDDLAWEMLRAARVRLLLVEHPGIDALDCDKLVSQAAALCAGAKTIYENEAPVGYLPLEVQQRRSRADAVAALCGLFAGGMAKNRQ